MELTDTERAVLDFESHWWKFAGAKETAIRERFGCSTAVYFARLNALIDRPEALAHAPALVRRLQRLRDQRREQRSAGRLDTAVGGWGRRVGVPVSRSK